MWNNMCAAKLRTRRFSKSVAVTKEGDHICGHKDDQPHEVDHCPAGERAREPRKLGEQNDVRHSQTCVDPTDPRTSVGISGRYADDGWNHDMKQPEATHQQSK